MDKATEDKVKRIVTEQLGPAIIASEARMTAHAASLVEDVRKEVRLDHAENRARFNQIYDMALQGVTQNKFIIDTVGTIQDGVQSLARAVGAIEGKELAGVKYKQDASADKERRNKMLLWLLGLIPFGAAAHWLANLLHIGKK